MLAEASASSMQGCLASSEASASSAQGCLALSEASDCSAQVCLALAEASDCSAQVCLALAEASARFGLMIGAPRMMGRMIEEQVSRQNYRNFAQKRSWNLLISLKFDNYVA